MIWLRFNIFLWENYRFIIFGCNNDKKFSISSYYWIKENIGTSTVDYVLN